LPERCSGNSASCRKISKALLHAGMQPVDSINMGKKSLESPYWWSPDMTKNRQGIIFEPVM
jgi:hypothetical protein